MTASYVWLPHDLVREVPALFIQHLRGVSGMVSAESDGVSDHAHFEHPSDHPMKALEAYIEKAEEFRKLLEEAQQEIADKLYHARELIKAKHFQDANKEEEKEEIVVAAVPELKDVSNAF